MRPDGLIAKFKERWQALDQKRKIMAVLITLGMVVSLFLLIRLAVQPKYANLFTGLEPKDAGIIVQKGVSDKGDIIGKKSLIEARELGRNI